MLQLGDGLTTDTKLYRYISLATFLSFVETRTTYVTNINTWEDPWEAAPAKLPIIRDDGTLKYPLWSIHKIIYAQCWTLTPESDAMWRIYSPRRDGLLIQTSVARFDLLQLDHPAHLAKVRYIDFHDLPSLRLDVWDWPLLKRRAFEHEREVRLVMVPHNLHGEPPDRFPLCLDPCQFIERIVIDPRASDWSVDTITAYCKLAPLEAVPERSRLYSRDIYGELRIATKYVPVSGSPQRTRRRS